MIKILLLLTLLTSSAFAAPTIILTPQNTVTIRGEINGESVNRAQNEIYELVKKRGTALYPLYLVLDTPGGSIMDGEDLVQYAKMIRNLNTITIFAASMGSAIVQGLPGKRYITENGIQMFHRAAGGFQGQFEDGEVESRLNFFKSLVRSLELRNAKRMSMSLEDYKSRVKDEMWLNSATSMSHKAADGIIDIRCTNELVEKREEIEMQILIFSVKLEFSGCPTFRIPKPVKAGNNEAVYKSNVELVKRKLSKGVL
jgi:ATP-dependent protease ClpP protease subunit